MEVDFPDPKSQSEVTLSPPSSLRLSPHACLSYTQDESTEVGRFPLSFTFSQLCPIQAKLDLKGLPDDLQRKRATLISQLSFWPPWASLSSIIPGFFEADRGVSEIAFLSSSVLRKNLLPSAQQIHYQWVSQATIPKQQVTTVCLYECNHEYLYVCVSNTVTCLLSLHSGLSQSPAHSAKHWLEVLYT